MPFLVFIGSGPSSRRSGDHRSRTATNCVKEKEPAAKITLPVPGFQDTTILKGTDDDSPAVFVTVNVAMNVPLCM
jgi:hypothetical protein